ncbi:3-isopropylmalate dehydratase small subunit [Niveispirillum sp. KHB5.9]|uniref:3-isopropylmalate dehydratase small subunit n=1 Tax=Niveispirillum sp. KHB5.9 TaxID=3400269 RepID=UPI003A8C5A2B
MEKFTRLTGVAAPLFRPNIDTDAIIPSREMKRVSKEGLGEGMFADWRYSDVAARVENPDFVLNRPPFRKAPILLAGPNFGCGSSREHAVWALQDYGVRCVIAPSFGAIFQGNCVRNGILPLVLPEPAVADLAGRDAPQTLTIDLAAQTVRVPGGAELPFTMPPADKEMLLEGLDAIGVTLKRLPTIQAFEGGYRTRQPWLFF